MKLKDFTNAAVAAIDKKLERFDPKWQAANGKGGLRSRYEDKTGIARYREWRGVKDTFVDYTAWLNNLLAMGKMVASAPIPILKGFWEYRWMGSYLGTFAFIDRLFEGYRDEELKIAHMNMHCIVNSLTKKIALVLANDRRLGGGKLSDSIVPMDEVMPPLFMTGFKNLIPIPIQTLPEFIICDIDQHLEPHYIDVAESFGLAADVCSRCSAETGVAIDDDFPIVGKAVLTTNMPCNASEATSMFQRRRFGLPDFPVTMAMIHNEPGAHPIASHLGGSSSDSRRIHSVTASQAPSTCFSVRCFLALGWISTSMHLLLHLTQFRMTKVRCRQFLSRHPLKGRGRNND